MLTLPGWVTSGLLLKNDKEDAMLATKKLGKSGPDITRIGFGAWAIGGPWQFGWGKQDDTESDAAISTALECGINWIDTAPAYGLGHSEEVVGNALKGKRESVFLATKCGIVWDNARRVKNSIDPQSILQEIDDSLRRLQTDYIDLYQIHWPDGKTAEEKAWETMLELKQKGKVRFIGVSNFDQSKMERCLRLGQIDSLQPPYSLLRRNVEKQLLPYCAEKNIGVVAYSPMMSGLLTGKFDLAKLASDDWRRRSGYFKEPFLGKALQFIEELKPIAQKYNKTIAQLSIAWTLTNSAVTAAIVGARRPRQVEEIIGGAGWTIDPNDLKTIDEISSSILGDQVFKDM
jgi:aryl-alcohol dehydrogenase-like predicted oxidoreductase